jgi:hypothetical protein
VESISRIGMDQPAPSRRAKRFPPPSQLHISPHSRMIALAPISDRASFLNPFNERACFRAHSMIAVQQTGARPAVRRPGSRDGGSISVARGLMGQVPMWRFREPTQPSGPRSVIDRAESLIHLSDTCLFSALRAKGFIPGTPKRNPVQ